MKRPMATIGAIPSSGCHAPSVQLFLQPDGTVMPCCRHLVGYGNIAETRLIDIWQGTARRELVERLDGFDYSAGCENCETEIAIEGEENSYARFFDVRAGHLAEGPDAADWPRWIDFNISNACNLQCVQCSGELSSAIRIHREKRPPLANPYGEEFFEDLALFIPHLDGALFAGGEPFLAPENYRVWQMIAELRPDISPMVTTNGTQWNARVREVLETLRFSFMVSMDGISAGTFESIRCGANLDEVLANVEHYRAYAARVGTTVSINHCLMVENVTEFADMLTWAETKQMKVNVSVVREPAVHSISRLAPDRLREVHRLLMAQDDAVSARLDLNASTWREEVDRIGAWAAQVQTGPGGVAALDRTVMFFRCSGTGSHDDAEATAELASLSRDGVVHVLDVGEDDVITGASESVRSVLGVDPAALVGEHFAAVDEVAVGRFGPRRRYEELGVTADRFDARGTYGDTELRIAMVAMRDASGTARHGRVLIAVCADGS